MAAELKVKKEYQGGELLGAPYLLKGHPCTKIKLPCFKCGGTGKLGAFEFCPKCNGAGYIIKETRLYTQQELDNYEKNKAAAIENQTFNLPITAKEKWFEKNGFTNGGHTYLIIGENTFKIKDTLKALGLKYSPELKWHGIQVEKLPNGYTTIQISFNDYFIWDDLEKKAILKEGAADQLKQLSQPQVVINSNSEYMGMIGTRYQHNLVTIKNIKEIMSEWGPAIIYTFDFNNNTLVWKTTSFELNDKNIGDSFYLTFTVKKHRVYNGEKITEISRGKLEI